MDAAFHVRSEVGGDAGSQDGRVPTDRMTVCEQTVSADGAGAKPYGFARTLVQ